MSSPSFSPLYVLFLLALCVIVAELLGKTRALRFFGTAFLVIILTAIVANFGFLPTKDDPVYDSVFTYIAPASIFLLLLGVNLKELRKVGIPMLALFVVGSIGTTIGVFIATLLIKDQEVFGGQYSALAGMIAGTYTGGALNFNAVALHYGVAKEGLIFASAIAVDNIVTVLWMFCTLLIPFIFGGKKKAHKVEVQDEENTPRSTTVLELSMLIGLTVFGLWFSETMAEYFSSKGIEIPSIILITTLALFLAQLPAVARLSFSHTLGSWLIYLFLAVVGASCDLAAMTSAGSLALLLLAFILIVIFIHILCVVGVARIFKWDWDIVAITSQANIGGSTTAMALAQSFNRNELVLPAIVIGSLGNALGTYIGFMVAGLV